MYKSSHSLKTYLRNPSDSDIGIFSYIDAIEPREYSLEVWKGPPETHCAPSNLRQGHRVCS
jgi:hypothetical protein